MTLKGELEILRGEPIKVFVGDPLEIPCVETSDPERLCKHPLVSVTMITYNHERFIRQAIEGVMMQKTNFEFELVIGEDCSSDKTREICFEYQKRYPDKIRVLWWHENLYRNPQHGGTNGQRNWARCRGEYIAFCEGDDYWTDPLKLQRQYDAMRGHPNVRLASCQCRVVDANGSRIGSIERLSSGVIPGRDLIREILSTFSFGITTCTFFVRRSVLADVSGEPFARRAFRCGDTQVVLMAAIKGDVFYDTREMVAYRRNSMSVTGTPEKNYFVGKDGLLVRYLFSRFYCDAQEARFCRNRFCSYVLDEGFAYERSIYLMRIFFRASWSGKWKALRKFVYCHSGPLRRIYRYVRRSGEYAR